MWQLCSFGLFLMVVVVHKKGLKRGKVRKQRAAVRMCWAGKTAAKQNQVEFRVRFCEHARPLQDSWGTAGGRSSSGLVRLSNAQDEKNLEPFPSICFACFFFPCHIELVPTPSSHCVKWGGDTLVHHRAKAVSNILNRTLLRIKL